MGPFNNKPSQSNIEPKQLSIGQVIRSNQTEHINKASLSFRDVLGGQSFLN